MKKAGLIREEEGRYTIDTSGILILDFAENIEKFHTFIERLNVPLSPLIPEKLPVEILSRFSHFSDSELISDIFSGVAIFLSIINEAKQEVKIAMVDIAEDILSIIERRGVGGKLILEDSNTHDLTGSGIEIKFLDTLPFQTCIGDRKRACIQFVDSSRRMYTPFLIPSSQEGISLCNDIFDYYWRSL